MKEHMKGKKHLRLAGLQERQQSVSERSIYVRGFPYSATENSLKKYFTRFGQIKSCFLEKEKVQALKYSNS